jgi:hypothetical protein
MSPGLVTFVPMSPRLAPDWVDGLIGPVFRRRWGVNYQDGAPVGLTNVSYRGSSVGVLGCVACHSGRAAGQYIVGLGNKNIDAQQVGRDLLMIENAWDWVRPDILQSADSRDMETSAIRFAELLSDEQRGNLVQGLVPVLIIRDWFYRQAHGVHPPDPPRGAVKVPSLWGYGEKRATGQFCDGFGDGDTPGWAVAVELVGGQSPEVVSSRGYYKKVENAEILFADLLPPPYPFPIDPVLAKKGQEVFEKKQAFAVVDAEGVLRTTPCAGCHANDRTSATGEPTNRPYYARDDKGHPIYEKPRFREWSRIQTDYDRLEDNTIEFRNLVEGSPLGVKSSRVQGRGMIKARSDRGTGYFAPRLVGIWARYPYLHNGSVPSIAALLTPPQERPIVFSLKDAGELDRFDPKTLGLTVPRDSAEQASLLEEAREGRRDVYVTNRCGRSGAFEDPKHPVHQHPKGCGFSNAGHPMGLMFTEDEKAALIEYLKTL